MERSARWVHVISIDERLLIWKELSNFLLLSCFTQQYLRIQFLSFSIFVTGCIVWKVVIFIHVLLIVDLHNCPRTLKHVFLELIRIFNCRHYLVNFLCQIRLVNTTKSHLVLHRNRMWNFTVLLTLMTILHLFRNNNTSLLWMI